MLFLLFLLFIVLPIFDFIYLFHLADRIGGSNVFFSVLLMFIIGLSIVKQQGRTFVLRVQTDLMRGVPPAESFYRNVLVLVAGILFMLPGFLTDILGLLILIPSIQHIVFKASKSSIDRQMQGGKFRVFTQGGFQGGFQSNPYGGFTYQKQSPERDVTPRNELNSQSSVEMSDDIIDVPSKRLTDE